jgi:hypothetical protein
LSISISAGLPGSDLYSHSPEFIKAAVPGLVVKRYLTVTPSKSGCINEIAIDRLEKTDLLRLPLMPG